MKSINLWKNSCLIAVLSLFFVVLSSMKQHEQVTLNPVGEYEFTSVDNGQTFTADLKITGEPGNYSGTARRHDIGKGFSFTDVAVSADKMIVVADVGNSIFVLRLKFSGDSFTGSWVMGTDGNELKGKRIK